MTVDRLPAHFQLANYGITPGDVVRFTLHCEPDAIQPHVIVMPNWQASIFAGVADEVTAIVESRVYRLAYRGRAVSVVRSGIGAPQTGDAVLALGCTACARVIFAGSAGGLRPAMRIGELLVVERSVCGDGFSRYLGENVRAGDRFLQPAEPDPGLTRRIKDAALPLCECEGVPLHAGPVYSTDSIVGQFGHINLFTGELACIGIEMETAAAFGAARLVGIRAAALLQLSDVIPTKQTILSPRPDSELARRRLIRETVLARAVLDALVD